jgi:hypothetical protein
MGAPGLARGSRMPGTAVLGLVVVVPFSIMIIGATGWGGDPNPRPPTSLPLAVSGEGRRESPWLPRRAAARRSVLSAQQHEQEARPGWGGRRRLQMASANGSSVSGLQRRRRQRLQVGGALGSRGAASGLCWPDSGQIWAEWASVVALLRAGPTGGVRPGEGGALFLVCARKGCLTQAGRA